MSEKSKPKDQINFFQGKNDLFISPTNNEELSVDDKIEKIRDKINEFFNVKNIYFLFGSGTSCSAIPNMSGLFEAVKKRITDLKDKKLDLNAEFVNVNKRLRNPGDLEELLGVLYSHRQYLEDHSEVENKDDVQETENTKSNTSNKLDICNDLISEIEEEIYNQINISIVSTGEIGKVLENYKRFYRKIAFRNKDLSRIHVFTTNNDMFNETSLDALNIHYINGFSGGLHKFFNPALFNYTFSKRMDTSIEKFEPVEGMVYLYKLHGSVNWIEDDRNSNTFFNIRELVDSKYDRNGTNVLVYPTPTKQNKSLGSPYSDMFREFQKKLLEPNSVLFITGYSFSDEHVNNIIYQALATNSSLNIVVFNPLKDKKIGDVDDNRIFRVWGEINDEKIHYFEYFSKHLIPDVDTFKKGGNVLENFVEFYKKELR